MGDPGGIGPEICVKALASGQVPAAEQPRCLQNMRFALDRIPPDAADER